MTVNKCEFFQVANVPFYVWHIIGFNIWILCHPAHLGYTRSFHSITHKYAKEYTSAAWWLYVLKRIYLYSNCQLPMHKIWQIGFNREVYWKYLCLLHCNRAKTNKNEKDALEIFQIFKKTKQKLFSSIEKKILKHTFRV